MITAAWPSNARRTAGEQPQSSQAVDGEQMLVPVTRVLKAGDGQLRLGQRNDGLEVVPA